MKKNKIFFRFNKFLILLCVVFSESCACVPSQDRLILTGFVLDEKSAPVGEMDLQVNTGTGGIVNVRTNEDGLFQIYHVKKGFFTFSGKKEGYSKLDEKMKISDFSKVLCFKISSADFVLEEVQGLVQKEHYKEAMTKLDALYPGGEKTLGKCISYYKKNINQKRREK